MNRRAILFLIIPLLFLSCEREKIRIIPNVIISTDIGGSDPDDFQSMVHLLMYADQLHLKGLISSPPHQGRKQHIEEVIEAYRKDYELLSLHSDQYPSPEYLLSITKQGAIDSQAYDTPVRLSDGASWIIESAQKAAPAPLYVLVWGSITDVAQAVHFDPGIKKNLRVYSIGSWNTKLDPNSRQYLYDHHPDLWWIENNTTFRGMYMGGDQDDPWGNLSFVETFVKDHGALGHLFWQKKKDIKMGDTPSLLYLLNGDPDDPEGESWGGAFIPTDHGPHYWTDNPIDSLIVNGKQGARTVSKYRKAYLEDWANRMKWIE